jgi:putative ABC transport system substrate-binding protein
VDRVTVEGFKAGLAELGYVEGRDLEFVYDGPAGHAERLQAAAQKLVASGVDLIFVCSTPATQAVMKATAGSGTPVVFGPVNDPLKAGVVGDLRKPGGNITGIRPPSTGGRRLQWFAEIAPRVRSVLVPFNPDNASSVATLEQAQAGAKAGNMEVRRFVVRNDAELTDLIAELPSDIDAIFLPRDALITARIDDFVSASIARRLPLSVPGRSQVRSGALYSYGFDHFELGRHAATLANRILRGAAPADLPVETSSASLSVNLETAVAIGLEIPDAVLRQTEEIVR